MKKILVMISFLLLLLAVGCGFAGSAVASADAGPPGVIMSMLSMDDAMSFVYDVGTPAPIIVAENKKFDMPTAAGLLDEGFGPAILACCNHKSHLIFGHLGGVSMALLGNPMAFVVNGKGLLA
jgi:hypothetical protein